MHDDELKKHYQEQSSEQSPQALDKLILQQARTEVEKHEVTKKSNSWRWQPRLATAASVAIVFLFAFQFRSLYWDTPATIESTSTEDVISHSTAVKSAPTKAFSPQQNIESTEADMISARQAEPEMLAELASQLPEQKKAAQKQRQLIQVQATESQLSQEDTKELDTDMAKLQQIQKLLEQGEINKAKILWQELQISYPETPDTEPLKTLWLSIKPAFE